MESLNLLDKYLSGLENWKDFIDNWANTMSAPPHHDDDDDNEEVFLDESDIIHEVAMDNEDLPDADDDSELGMNLP